MINKTYIKSYVDSCLPSMERAIERLVRIPSLSEDRVQALKALDEALALGEELGFKTRKAAGGEVGIISMGPENTETLGILVHVDVVPAGEEEDWTYPPFSLTKADGFLFGRGTIDDKGPLVATLYAMKCLKDSGEKLHKEVQLVIGTREEIIWTDMERYAKEERLPDYGFTPDDSFPICNVEKGYVDAIMEFPWELSAEDGWQLESITAGEAGNTVPGRAEAMLVRLEGGKAAERRSLKAAGKAVHSSEPERGENAIFLLTDLAKKEITEENRLMAILEALKEAFEDVYGSGLGLASESEYYKGEYVHVNTFCPTMANTEGGVLRVNINGRTTPLLTPEEVLEKLGELAESLGGRAILKEGMPAVLIEKERPFVKAFSRAYREITGLEGEYRTALGTSYAKAMPNVAAWGPLLPGDEDSCHEVDENISLKTLVANAEIFAMAIGEIAGSERSFK